MERSHLDREESPRVNTLTTLRNWSYLQHRSPLYLQHRSPLYMGSYHHRQHIAARSLRGLQRAWQ
jgi:hypothetical protein